MREREILLQRLADDLRLMEADRWRWFRLGMQTLADAGLAVADSYRDLAAKLREVGR